MYDAKIGLEEGDSIEITCENINVFVVLNKDGKLTIAYGDGSVDDLQIEVNAITGDVLRIASPTRKTIPPVEENRGPKR